MKGNIELIKKLKEKEMEASLLVDSLKLINKKLIITIAQQNKLLKIEEQFKPLEQSGYFHYLSSCKKYIIKDFMGVEIFESNNSKIKKEYIEITKNIGKELQLLLRNLNSNNPDLSYLLVIEGNMANYYDKSINKDNDYGFKKSYERALAVYNLWVKNGINLRDYNTEILICGSGFNGLCRDENEDNNKRFSIQLIPKVQNR